MKEYVGCDGDVAPPHKKLAATEVAKRFAKPKKTNKISKVTALPYDYMERYEKRQESLPFGKQKVYLRLL